MDPREPRTRKPEAKTRPATAEELDQRQEQLIQSIEEDPEYLQAFTNEVLNDLSHPRGLLGRLGYRTSTG